MSLMYGVSSAMYGLASVKYGMSSAMYGNMSAKYDGLVLDDKTDSQQNARLTVKFCRRPCTGESDKNLSSAKNGRPTKVRYR